jgi:anthranilate synthase component 2
MKILLIDNYDSFTWNLHHTLLKAGANVVNVVKNDAVEDEQAFNADAVVFSPGPGLPEEAGRMKEIIRLLSGTKKMLGICLGHQAIAEVFGAGLIHADEIFHGTSTKLEIKERSFVFRNLPAKVFVGRYHSWVVSTEDFPEALQITATDEKGVIMAFRHRSLEITGVQFHPESILTPLGEKMIRNWMHS